MPVSVPHGRPVDQFDLGPPAGQDVAEHRRPATGGAEQLVLEGDPLLRIEGDSLGPRNLAGLPGQVVHVLEHDRQVADDGRRQPGQGHRGQRAAVEDELGPLLAPDIGLGQDADGEVDVLEGGRRPCCGPEVIPPRRPEPRVPHARVSVMSQRDGDDRVDGHPDEGLVPREGCPDRLLVAEAVLERQEDRGRPDERPHPLDRGGRRPALDHEQHQLDGLIARGRVARCRHPVHIRRPVGAVDPEADVVDPVDELAAGVEEEDVVCRSRAPQRRRWRPSGLRRRQPPSSASPLREASPSRVRAWCGLC